MGLVRVGVRFQFQTLGCGVVQRSPVILHERVTKRYIEFNFSPEKKKKLKLEVKLLTEVAFLCMHSVIEINYMILGLAVLYTPVSLLRNREIAYHVLSYGFVITVKITFFQTFFSQVRPDG